MGIARPGLLGDDGVHLAEKGKSIFSRSFTKLVKRALMMPGQGKLNTSHCYQFDAHPSSRCPEPGEGLQIRRRAPAG